MQTSYDKRDKVCIACGHPFVHCNFVSWAWFLFADGLAKGFGSLISVVGVPTFILIWLALFGITIVVVLAVVKWAFEELAH